jgi:chromosomal replication initiator protein
MSPEALYEKAIRDHKIAKCGPTIVNVWSPSDTKKDAIIADLRINVQALRKHISELEAYIRKMTIEAGAAGVAASPIVCGKIAPMVDAVCAVFDVTRSQLVGSRRTSKFVVARRVVMHLAHKYTEHSMVAIGRAIGDRDHTTILAGLRAIATMRKADPELDQKMAELERVFDLGRPS